MSIDLASYIDHTLLKQTTTLAEVDKLCVEASMEGFAAVCIPPKYVPDARKLLDGSKVKIATVIGFPLGYNVSDAKLKEITEAIDMGADELDMVHDLCAVKNGNWKLLERELKLCLKPVADSGKVMKVILETGILTDAEIVKCCEIYSDYKIDFIKTSTGYADIGASVHAVELIKKHIPARMGIKASGGIKTLAFAMELINAGATRLGCSASYQIMKEKKEADKVKS